MCSALALVMPFCALACLLTYFHTARRGSGVHCRARGEAAQGSMVKVPEVGSCASARQLWLARRSQGRDRPTGPQATASGARASRLPSKAAHCPAFGTIQARRIQAALRRRRSSACGSRPARGCEADERARSRDLHFPHHHHRWQPKQWCDVRPFCKITAV